MDKMEQSIRQGLDYLKNNREHFRNNKETVVFDVADGLNFATADTAAAKGLEEALDKGIGHSGSSFGEALRQTFHRASRELDATAKYKSKRGFTLRGKAGGNMPRRTNRIVLSF